jgi:hypothetical protein
MKRAAIPAMITLAAITSLSCQLQLRYEAGVEPLG